MVAAAVTLYTPLPLIKQIEWPAPVPNAAALRHTWVLYIKKEHTQEVQTRTYHTTILIFSKINTTLTGQPPTPPPNLYAHFFLWPLKKCCFFLFRAPLRPFFSVKTKPRQTFVSVSYTAVAPIITPSAVSTRAGRQAVLKKKRQREKKRPCYICII